MSGISKEIHHSKEVFVVDFSNCKESQMIELIIEFRSLIIASNKPQLTLAILNDKSFLTTEFMIAFRKEKREEVTPFISKQAVVGLTDIKKMILKGYNLFFNRDIRAFDSKEAAINFLITE